MKIKYGEIEFYSKWLLEHLTLAGKRSRMRVRLIEILGEHQAKFERFRMDLIKEHAQLDENGDIVVIERDENGSGQADIIDPEAFRSDLQELLLEEFVVEENETNREMLLVLKECVDECPVAWSGQAALEYEAVCRLFEGIYHNE